MPVKQDDQLIDDLAKRHSTMVKEREIWEDLWQDLIDYFSPTLGTIYRGQEEDEKGKRLGKDLFSSYAILQRQRYVDGMQGQIVAQNIPWMRLKMAYDPLDNIPKVKATLQEHEKLLYSLFASTSFYDQSSQYFDNGITIGSANMHIDEDAKTQQTRFITHHPREVYLSRNTIGQVTCQDRPFYMSIEEAMDTWPDAPWPQDLVDQKSSAPWTEYEFIHSLYMRTNRDYAKLDKVNKPVASVYWMSSRRLTLDIGGYDEFPTVTWTYRRNPREAYGRGPACDALVDVMRLNQISKSLMYAAQLKVEPILNVPREMEGRVRITPRSINYYEESGRIIIPTDIVGNDFPVGEDREAQIRAVIDKHFNMELFLILRDITQKMTATEVMQRTSEKAALFGPIISRITTEFLNPMIDRVWQNEYRNGRLPPLPPEVEAYPNARIDVDYLGPMAIAQKQLFRASGVISSLEVLSTVFQMRPETMINLDWDQLTREIADTFGMPQQILRDVRDVMAEKNAMRRQQQQAMLMQQQLEVAKTAGNTGLGKAPEEGSVLDTVMRGGVPAEKKPAGLK